MASTFGRALARLQCVPPSDKLKTHMAELQTAVHEVDAAKQELDHSLKQLHTVNDQFQDFARGARESRF